jgi:DNA repair protein RadC
MPPKSALRVADEALPHYLGHRQRLRQRFLTGGPSALADYELLELLLGLALPRQDVKPLAKSLLARFGGFAGVMAAEPAQLMEITGVKEASAAAIKIVQAASLLMLRQQVMNRPVLGSWQQVLEYCHAVMAHEGTEQFRLLFLDNKNQLIADEMQSKGTVDHTPVYVREVVKRALTLGASALVMAHNHPAGDPTPSRDDILMTRLVEAALDKVGIRLHDHIIVGRNAHASLRSLGHIGGGSHG